MSGRGYLQIISDALKRKTREEISAQSLLGNGYIASFRHNVLAGETHDQVLEVPEGIKVYLHAQHISVTGGSIEWQVRMNPDPYTVDSTVKGYNLDEELDEESGASLVMTDPLTTGSLFRREGVLYTNSSGNNLGLTTDVDVAAQSDAVPQYVSNRYPVLRLENVSGDDATVIVTYIWAELPR